MNRKIIIAILITILIGVGCSPAVSTPEENLNDIETVITELASGDLKGRLPGTEGNERAVEIIVNRFKNAGLEPYSIDSYYHLYKQEVYNPDQQTHKLVVQFQDGSQKEYVFGEDYYNASRDKVVHVNSPTTFDPSDKDLKNKVLIYDGPKLPLDLMKNTRGILKVTDLFLGKAGVLGGEPRAWMHITRQMYDELYEKKAINIEIVEEYTTEEEEVKNIVGILPGKNHKKALVLSAHFDHVGWAGDTIFYGAVDNASGTAVLLNLAERLSNYSKKYPFKTDIIFAAFNGEEYRLSGSNAFVKDIKERYEELYNINLDCVGKKGGGVIALDQNKEVNGKLIEAIKTHLNNKGIPFDDVYAGSSDSKSFNVEGFSAITIGQMKVDGIHTINDTVETIDYEYLLRLSDAIYDFVIANNGMMY